MTTTRLATRTMTVLVLGLAVAVGRVTAQSRAHFEVPPEKVQWGPAPPVLPAGAEISVLDGNPAAKGPVVLRLKFPANYEIPAHWHSMDERITVLSGSFRVGMGDALDRQRSDTLGPGGFLYLPATMHHFAWTSVPTVVQINLEGPFDIHYINPTDDPLKKQTKR